LLGYDIDESLPWHSTISRTRQLYGEELFKQLFKNVLKQCITDHADKKDSQCLSSLLNNTMNNLKEEGLQIEEVFADAGYSSGEALKALEENDIIGYIPNFGQHKPSREGFTYDKENDRYTCSRGVHLP